MVANRIRKCGVDGEEVKGLNYGVGLDRNPANDYFHYLHIQAEPMTSSCILSGSALICLGLQFP